MTSDWHLNKGVSMGVIFTIFIQLVLIISFFTTMNNRIGNLEEWKIETSSSRFTNLDGELLKKDITQNRRDVEKIFVKLDSMQRDIILIKVAVGAKDLEFGG